MANNYSNKGLKIGTTFTIISLLLTFTFIVPILSILPGVLIENLAKGFVNNEPYSNVGKMTIQILWIIFFFSLLVLLYSVYLKLINMEQISTNFIVLVMIIMYFIIHPLGFYIYWALKLNYRGDGQLIFAAVRSFPYSSFGFILIGILLDFTKIIINKLQMTNP